MGIGIAVPTSYSNDSHRLQAVGASGRSYDANGNTTRRDLSSRSDATLVYDERNRLASVTSSGGNSSYRHNARGERVLKNAAGKLTRYAYDESGRLLAEDGSAAGGAVQQMLWLDDLPVGLLIGNTLYRIQPDHLGSPRKITSGTVGASTLHWNWPILDNPFGQYPPDEDPNLNGSKFPFNLRFPGQQYDAETGLNYNYFRDYEPGVGRYVESDPIGLDGGDVSTYTYVKHDPLNHMDPEGLAAASGARRRVRDCTSDEWTQCRAMCAGKGVRSCKRQQIFQQVRATNRNGTVVTAWIWKDQGLSCDCNDPDACQNAFERAAAALGIGVTTYVIISELSRLFPPRNLVPVP